MRTIQEQYGEIQRAYQEGKDPEGFYQKLKELEFSFGKSKWDYGEPFLVEFYTSFAFVCFDLGKYCDFFDYLVEACRYGYDISVLQETLYEAFVKPNQETFRQNYKQNISIVQPHLIKYGEDLSFDNLRYHMLPTEKEDIFFFMHKRTGKIDGRLNVALDRMIPPKLENEFAGIVIRRDVEELLPYLIYSTFGRKCYYTSENIDKLTACMQSKFWGPTYLKNLVVVKNYEQLTEYLEKNEEYLPWNIIAYKKHKDDLYERLTELWERRIKKGISGQPLLSICIPSYNRGEKALANVRKILAMNFDYEVELILSNNGSDNETKNDYLELSKIEDSRFIYHEFESNQGYLRNSCKVADLARGRFFMLLSDEDSLYEVGLYQILNLLRNRGKDLAVIKTPHQIQGDCKPGYAAKGIDAYQEYMLTSNYLSINIYQKDLLKGYIYYPYEHRRNKACLHYSHMCWELFALQHGDVMSTEIFLVEEGEESDILGTEAADISETMTIREYQTLEGRLEQHSGFLEVIRDLDIYKKQKNSRLLLYWKLCFKTFSLVNISINLFYGEDNRIPVMKKVREYCKKGLEEISKEITKEQLDLGNKGIDELYLLFIGEE